MSVHTKPDFSQMAAKWPSSHVSRDRAEDFTGGLVKPKTLANLDSKGLGPPGRIRVVRKICYPVGPFIKWLESRSVLVD